MGLNQKIISVIIKYILTFQIELILNYIGHNKTLKWFSQTGIVLKNKLTITKQTRNKDVV